MINQSTQVSNKLDEYASKQRRRIAVGLDPEKRTPEDLQQIQKDLCDVVCVGKKVEGFEYIDSCTPESTILDLLLADNVDGVVRGQLDHTRFVNYLLECQQLAWSDLHLVSLLRHESNLFWLAPVSNTECWIKHDKTLLIKK
jgi:predicted methyltransferase MtxX (methanogen marker protein 4)